MPDGKKRGTFRSYSVFIDAHDVTLRNLTVENASGASVTHGQAIALYADGDRIFVDSCRLLGHQDTLFTGPLPPKELQPDGFIGPKQFAPRINGRQYYKNCYICGDVDFIFGSATAFFEGCTIESLQRISSSSADTSPKNPIQGYVTAASTPKGQEYGYVFSHCRLISRDCPAASVYLGRPWRDYARTVFLHCALGEHIHPAGFHDWNKENARANVLYAEYENYPAPESGENASCLDGNCRAFPNRADFVCTLDAVEAAHFSRDKVLGGDDGWMCDEK
jgi:pectinesterase